MLGLSKNASILWLVLANLIPLVGVLIWGWDVATLLLLYWVETVIIGIWNIPKIVGAQSVKAKDGPSALGGKIFLAVFFTVHYGFFNFGHFMFLRDMFDLKIPTLSLGNSVMISALAFFASHGISTLINYFGKGEYKATDPNAQMFKPYARIFAMHVVILIGGGLVMASGQPVIALLILIMFKIGIDVVTHRKMHAKLQSVSA